VRVPVIIAVVANPGGQPLTNEREIVRKVEEQIGTLSNPIFPEIYRRPATAAGGSLLAADLLAQGGIIYNPGGGTHHGMADHAAGFCYLNDPVLAIQAFLAQSLCRIAYVDIDAHHCDGVATAFHGDPRVLMISTHEEARWPFTGALDDRAGSHALNLPLPRGTHDDAFALLRDTILLPAVQDWRPDVIVLQCGADAVLEDPLARLALSNNAHWSVVTALKQMAPRLLVLGGGGYNPWTVGRLWSGVWATLNGLEIPDRPVGPRSPHLDPPARRPARPPGRNAPRHAAPWPGAGRNTPSGAGSAGPAARLGVRPRRPPINARGSG